MAAVKSPWDGTPASRAARLERRGWTRTDKARRHYLETGHDTYVRDVCVWRHRNGAELETDSDFVVQNPEWF
jgi:hypothetical protein